MMVKLFQFFSEKIFSMTYKTISLNKNSLVFVITMLTVILPSHSYSQEVNKDNIATITSTQREMEMEMEMEMEVEVEEVVPEQDALKITTTATVPSDNLENQNIATNTGATVVPHSGAYYDSSSFGGGSFGTAPTEVDPKYEPGSRFVVVERSAGANSFSSQLVSAQRALSLGRYSSALEIYENLYKKDRNNTRVLMGLAVAQQNNGFNESAIATYEELLKKDPKNVDATVNMLGLITAGNPEQAYIKLSQIWENNNRSPAVASQLGLTAAQLGDLEKAIRYVGIASSIEPNNPNHYYNMAVISDRAGLTKQAIEFYQKSLEMDASTNAFRILSRDVIYERLAVLRRL